MPERSPLTSTSTAIQAFGSYRNTKQPPVSGARAKERIEDTGLGWVASLGLTAVHLPLLPPPSSRSARCGQGPWPSSARRSG